MKWVLRERKVWKDKMKREISPRSTQELDRVLQEKDYKSLDDYLEMYTFQDGDISAADYLTERILAGNLKKKDVIARSGVAESLGYRLLNGTKMTTDRDKIIGLCIGAQLTLEETDIALRLAGFGKLYSKNRRDAVIIYGIQNGYKNVMELNEELEKRGLEILNL